MAIFYDWRDRTGKGWKPLREQIKELRSPVFIVIGIILFFSIAFLVAVYFGYWRPYVGAKSERVYLLPDPVEQRAAMSETGAALRPMPNVKSDDLNPSREVQDERYAETEDSVSSDSIATAGEVKTDNSTALVINQEDKTTVEPTISELEAIDAETERLLIEGDMIQRKAIESMNQAIPVVVDHLNSLSVEDQQTFLAEVKTQILSHTPPELQKLYAQNPELKDKGYELFLQLLRENGYEDLR